MPNRILRDGILTSKAINALSPLAELFYRRLMSVVDDFGRMEYTPELLVSRCYPLQFGRVSPQDAVNWLHECRDLIELYSHSEHTYLEIKNFGQRERVSKCPSAAECRALPRNAARASTPTPTPHSSLDLSEENSESRARDVGTEIIPIAPEAPLRDAGYRAFMGVFLQLGLAISEADQMQCARLWVSLSDEDARAAPVWAAAEYAAVWRYRDLEFVPRPKTVLREKRWQRRAVVNGRERPATPSERGQDLAARMFLAKGASP